MIPSESTYNIIDLLKTDVRLIDQVAELLHQAFRFTSPDSWPEIVSALAEVHESLESGRISRIVVDHGGDVIGWIGAISHYAGNAWELHPIIVHPDYQCRGIGTALVRDLEAQILSRGGTTLWLGTDDESNRTSLGGITLYPDVLSKLSTIRNIQSHPFEFFQRVGFCIVGVIPDANGIGKPDILMAMRVG